MDPNPSLKYSEHDFSKVIAFDYILKVNRKKKKQLDCREDMIELQNIGSILREPNKYLHNLNINDSKLYFEEYSKQPGNLIISLTQVFKPNEFQKISKIGVDSGKLFFLKFYLEIKLFKIILIMFLNKKIRKGCEILMGYQFNFPKSELLKDLKERVFLNEKFLTNKLYREMIKNIERKYGFVGPLDMKVIFFISNIIF